MVGLGRMGANMTVRLLRGGHEVVAYDVRPEATRDVVAQGAAGATALEDLAARLEPPRSVWVMVPAGEITAQTLEALGEALEPGDLIVDGGNSHFTDTQERARLLEQRGIRLLDAGTSGGVWGLKEGYCLMVGGEQEDFGRIEPVLKTLAPADGYAHVGPSGAGHFVKMVHNGVEYALLQAYGEGFELLERGPFELDLPAVAEVWRHGSVVRSWLLDLTALALRDDPHLETVSDWMNDSGEGRWTVQTAIDHALPTPTIALSLFARFSSRQEQSFAGKLVAALRKEFGGHSVR